MTTYLESTDLVLVVWPRRSELAIRLGHQVSRQDAASGDWAMDQDKANRVRIVVSVHENEITGAWAVRGNTNTLEAPEGKTRRVNRVHFDTYEDNRLAYLIGQTSPLSPRRNPQATIEVRDLPGHEGLLGHTDDEPTEGVVRLGGYVLTVRPDGNADLVTPSFSTVTIRPAGSSQ